MPVTIISDQVMATTVFLYATSFGSAAMELNAKARLANIYKDASSKSPVYTW